ncbi:polysaccharide deacetylase family protein [Paenibacillus gorillae]|uniref:polysaccharide deacetylase family protein n=1 Tax=Paenibacillus gorillae TaxID=1243662 RepID=UPI0004BC4203|nr:polysaccharide deacetylase family protein [Paenibacillus gorillae]
METNKIRMIELLSLRQEPDHYRMELCVTASEERNRFVLDIDEHTFHQLSAAVPRTGERVRLSLYPKWDAFGKRFNSSLTKVNRDTSLHFPFTCTKCYVKQLESAMREEALSVQEEHRASVSTTPNAGQKQSSEKVHFRLLGKRFRYIAARLAVFTIILCLASITMNRELFEDYSDPLSHRVIAASSNETLTEPSPAPWTFGPGIVQAASWSGWNEKPLVESMRSAKQDEEKIQPAEPEKKLSYEVVQLPADKLQYSLPKGYVALTFDDGPSVYTEQIVDILKENDVAATFLFIGKNAKRKQEAAAYASEQGMVVGNHSWSHSDLSQAESEKALIELKRTNELLEEITGDPTTIFRPPYGAVSNELKAQVKQLGMKTLMWNRDPEDWSVKSAADIVKYFHQTNPSGGIYVLHEKKITAEALPEIIDYLKKKKLKFAVFE